MLITVVIPVYDVERDLKTCLDSLLAQTFADWEAVCVDDGSADGSGAILEEYAKRDGRFRVVHQANAGVSAARNTALELARGEWVGFLDPDDWVEPDWLESAAAEMRKTGPDLVRGGFRRFDETRGVTVTKAAEARRISGADEVMRWGWTTLLNGGAGMVWACFYRREMLVASGVKFAVGCPALEDAMFNANLLMHVSSAVQLGSAGYVYRQRGGSAMRRERRFEVMRRIVAEGAAVYRRQRGRIAELGLTAVAYRQMVKLVWRNVHAWMMRRPAEERGMGSRVSAAVREVLEPCVADRFARRCAAVRRAILAAVCFLCSSVVVHVLHDWALKVRVWRRE